MQPGEEIESLVDELEQIVTEAKSPIMDNGQKKIVDAQDIYEILDEIRRVFPQEFADARRILKEEQETIDRAQQQASSIIADAQQQAMILAGDQEIVRLAQQQADAILAQAQQDAQQYMRRAQAELQESNRHAQEQLKRESVALAVEIAGKILQQELTEQKQQAMIDRYLEKVG